MPLYALTLKKVGAKTPTRPDYGRWFSTLMKYHFNSVSVLHNVFEYGKHDRLHVHGILAVAPGFNLSNITYLFKTGWHVYLKEIECDADLQRWRIYLNKEQEPEHVAKDRYEQYLILGAGYPFVKA